MSFATTYREYIKVARRSADPDFNIKTLARIERPLAFLYQDWYKVELQGLKRLPEGAALIVANAGGVLPWAGLMLLYALMSDCSKPRKLHILTDLSWIEDERIYNFLRSIGFVSLSADNARRLLAAGETVLVFPEGQHGALKPFKERYRLRSFDWTVLLTAIEMNVPLVPLATIGPDESFPMGTNFTPLAKLLAFPAYPIMAAFPWLFFPANLFSLSGKWKMHLMKPSEYKHNSDRSEIEEIAKKQALHLEGEIQSELNKILRTRIKSY